MKNIRIRQGARLHLKVEQADPASVSAQLIMKNQETGDTITAEGTYVSGEVVLEVTDTEVIGVYDYQINELFDDDTKDKYPDPDDCEDDCEFPTITICDALDIDEES